jgi:hypothetical protein
MVDALGQVVRAEAAPGNGVLRRVLRHRVVCRSAAVEIRAGARGGRAVPGELILQFRFTPEIPKW